MSLWKKRLSRVKCVMANTFTAIEVSRREERGREMKGGEGERGGGMESG